jgi:hypothetical protein
MVQPDYCGTMVCRGQKRLNKGRSDCIDTPDRLSI